MTYKDEQEEMERTQRTSDRYRKDTMAKSQEQKERESNEAIEAELRRISGTRGGDTMNEQAKEYCVDCGETIYLYCHSQAGNLKAYAWTTVDEYADEDQRWGTTCDQDNTSYPGLHHPASFEDDDEEEETR